MKYYTVEVTIEDGYDIEANSVEEAESKALQEAMERYNGTAGIYVNAIEKSD